MEKIVKQIVILFVALVLIVGLHYYAYGAGVLLMGAIAGFQVATWAEKLAILWAKEKSE